MSGWDSPQNWKSSAIKKTDSWFVPGFDILNLKFQGRFFIFFTNKQPGVSPLDIEISIESNAEVLIRHLGNVFDINSNCNIRGPCSTQLFH